MSTQRYSLTVQSQRRLGQVFFYAGKAWSRTPAGSSGRWSSSAA